MKERVVEAHGESFGEHTAQLGLIAYVCFAPHSIAAAQTGLSIAILGWLIRLVQERKVGIRRTPLDLSILLFFLWTVLSALFSEETRTSLLKLQTVAVFIVFYLTQSIIKRRTVMLMIVLLLVSCVVGTMGSVVDLVRGRGVVVAGIASDSPFHELLLGEGKVVWRINSTPVNSVDEIDNAIRSTPTGTRVLVGIIAERDQSVRPGFIVTEEMKARPSPSGLTGGGRTHLFRASAWTGHYEMFAEILQMSAQLALGLALANLRSRKARLSSLLAFAAYAVISVGVALTAMRTVIVALAIGSTVIVWRAARGRARLLITFALLAMLALGALTVALTRDERALLLQDASASLRLEVARVAFRRVWQHPIFGHGMDAVKEHWTEWGFPGKERVHTHSTPLQLAFERGLPALIFWLWIITAFWLFATRAEKMARNSDDLNRHGILLGATGALAGFFASSLVNYNFGDSEVALLFWWLMGLVVALAPDVSHRGTETQKEL
jgi:hypothetical protein